MKIKERFKDSLWLKYNTKTIIIGLGGIGSNVVEPLVKTLNMDHIIIVDNDLIEEQNIGTQNFLPKNVNKYKTITLGSKLSELCNVYTVTNKIENLYNECSSVFLLPIVIVAVDNMQTREFIFEKWIETNKNNSQKWAILVDGRLNINMYEVFLVDFNNKKSIDAYKESLKFKDKDLEYGSCTMRQTMFFGGLIGNRIVHIVTNYLNDKYIKENNVNFEVYKVPFYTKEIGDSMSLIIMTPEEYINRIKNFNYDTSRNR